MTLRDLMDLHARTTLVRADHFGETVTYVYRDDNDPKDIPAVVHRLGRQPARPGVPQGTRLVAHVFIPRDPTTGIAQFNDGDKLLLAMRLGDEPRPCRIEQVLEEDEASYLFEVMS